MIDDSLQKGTVPELDALVPSVATETPWAKGGEDNEEAVRNSIYIYISWISSYRS